MPDVNSSIAVLNPPFATSALTQTLASEGVLEALKMIFTDAPLNDVLHSVALLIEAQTGPLELRLLANARRRSATRYALKGLFA